MLKQSGFAPATRARNQPPSGGCVLKPRQAQVSGRNMFPAAFGRLRVETPTVKQNISNPFQPPSGGCVLKLKVKESSWLMLNQPPSGGCVLKLLATKFKQ